MVHIPDDDKCSSLIIQAHCVTTIYVHIRHKRLYYFCILKTTESAHFLWCWEILSAQNHTTEQNQWTSHTLSLSRGKEKELQQIHQISQTSACSCFQQLPILHPTPHVSKWGEHKWTLVFEVWISEVLRRTHTPWKQYNTQINLSSSATHFICAI